jgi:hypothetical protein
MSKDVHPWHDPKQAEKLLSPRKYRPRKQIIRISHEEIEEAMKDFLKEGGKITILDPSKAKDIGFAGQSRFADEFLTEDIF